MFDFVRSHTRLLQGLLVLLVFPSFVFFGVQGYSHFTDEAASAVATVAGQPIRKNELETAHRQQIEQMRQQMPGIDVKLLDTPEARQQTLESLVRERVLQTAVQKQHLTVSDLRLQRLFLADPQYAPLRQPDGSINKDYLAARGMSARQLEDILRQEYSLRQVLAGVSGSALTGKTTLESGLGALLEQREVQIQRFEAKDYLARMNPSAAEVEAFYKAHADRFRAPDEASIQYVVLDLDALKKQVTVSEDDLRKYYEQNISRYTTPEERRASHILITAAQDAPAEARAKAKAQAQELLAQLRKSPAAFAELARKNSQDPGSAAKGGDLDYFGRGAMVKPFEDAAFALKTGEISDVVESEFGYHIIQLTAVRGGERKPFDAVRAEAQDEVARQLAQQRYAEAAEQFSNLVYEQSDSLQPVVDKLKLTLASAVVHRDAQPGAAGPLASAKLLEAVFAADSVQNKRNTEAIETGSNQLAAARVVEYRPAHVRALDEVRAQVTEQLRADQAAAAARKDGEARLAQLQKNPAEALGPTLTVSRTQTQGQPRSVVDAVLKADLAKAPALSSVDLGPQGFAVIKVSKTVARDAADPDLARGRPYVVQALAQAEAQAYYEGLKRRFKVDVKAAAAAKTEGAASAAQ